MTDFPIPKRSRRDVDSTDSAVDTNPTTAVLIYNVSLNDMLVATRPLPDVAERKEFPDGLPGLARPLFSSQSRLAEGIAAALIEEPGIVSWPEMQGSAGTEMAGDKESLPVGLELPADRARILPAAELRFRRMEDGTGGLQRRRSEDLEQACACPRAAKPCGGASSPVNQKPSAEPWPTIVAVLFPLLSAVMTAWLRGAAAHVGRRVVVLLSGRVEPRDLGADSQGNSTEHTALLMARFLRQAYGSQGCGATVHALHGAGDAFRYDANLRFCHEMLLPLLDTERGEVARQSGDKWPERFSLTLALCDGTHSRTQVLSSCLREYRPEMAHLTPLKAFWHSCLLQPYDVDRACYDRAFEALPPTEVASLEDPALSALIAEIIAHRNSFLFAQPRDQGRSLSRNDSTGGSSPSGDADLERFWLRKTRKPVLSVLLVQREGGPLRMHRGINLEVSMPTGSLCSERNVIGTAFASDPSLRREDLRAIAILAVDNLSPTSTSKGRNPLAPCGVCMEWLQKIYEVNPSFRVLTFVDEACRRVFIKTVGRLRN